ncbi:MAG: cysteine--tRNA ligase [bacterium]|nr:cysteine--tRNA ligase [bacterium]
MSLKLYNTLTNKEEEFKSINKGKVSMYTCGPTVYGRPHIGNYSSFLMADLLRRWLEASGYAVSHVKNITDVGHLVADADSGEDKIEMQAMKEHGEVTHDSVIKIARTYEEQYLADEIALNFREPEHRPRATEFIQQMKDMIETLLKNGHAYVIDDGIYFDVESFADYGKLSGNTLENLAAGSRVAVDKNKKHSADFALWKFCTGHNENHALRWPSPGGGDIEGFPGWHIECSAMSSALLGEQIDIHTGGEDNIFPHHECEIAQSESVTGKTPFVSLWMHRRRIDMGDTKMSKSLGNVLTLSDIEERGYSPLDLRYYFLSVHYRTNLKFTEKGLDDAHKARRKIMEWMDEVPSSEFRVPSTDQQTRNPQPATRNTTDWSTKFTDAMNSDLNTPAALAVVFDCMTWSRGQSFSAEAHKELSAFIAMVRSTFGCFDAEEAADIPADVQALVDQRAAARTNKDYDASDKLRDEIKVLGYEVRDDGGEQIIRKL